MLTLYPVFIRLRSSRICNDICRWFRLALLWHWPFPRLEWAFAPLCSLKRGEKRSNRTQDVQRSGWEGQAFRRTQGGPSKSSARVCLWSEVRVIKRCFFGEQARKHTLSPGLSSFSTNLGGGNDRGSWHFGVMLPIKYSWRAAGRT